MSGLFAEFLRSVSAKTDKGKVRQLEGRCGRVLKRGSVCIIALYKHYRRFGCKGTGWLVPYHVHNNLHLRAHLYETMRPANEQHCLAGEG